MKKILTIIMSAALMFSLAIPTFADEIQPRTNTAPDSNLGYPSYPNELLDGYGDPVAYNRYIIFKRDNGSTHLLVIGSAGKKVEATESTYDVNGNDKTFRFKAQDVSTGDAVKFGWYLLENINGVNTWSKEQTGSLLYSRFSINGVASFVYSDFDIVDYKNSENILFPVPPPIYQKLTEEVPNLVVQPMMKILSILVPFGVGLMALLILLVILKKVFYLFRI